MAAETAAAQEGRIGMVRSKCAHLLLGLWGRFQTSLWSFKAGEKSPEASKHRSHVLVGWFTCSREWARSSWQRVARGLQCSHGFLEAETECPVLRTLERHFSTPSLCETPKHSPGFESVTAAEISVVVNTSGWNTVLGAFLCKCNELQLKVTLLKT